MIEYYIFYNKMIIVNCIVEKNIPIEASINTGTDVNYISQKYISELENLDECVDKKTLIDLIQEIVPLLIGKKGKTSSEFSKDSDSNEIIEGSHRYQVREKKDVPYKQRRKV